MLSRLIRMATGRSYEDVGLGDVRYMLAKGGVPLARGTAWCLAHGRRPNGFLLGPRTQILMSHQLERGRGVSIGGFSYIDCAAAGGIVLGDGVTIREFAWIQGRSGMNRPAEILEVGARPVVIGTSVQIGAGLSIAAESHVRGSTGTYVDGTVERQGISIGDRSWIGNNVTILDGVDIGTDCVIGAGSVVTRSIPSGTTAYGAPARPASR